MLFWKNPGWFGDRERKRMLDPYVDQAGTAWFGLKQVRTSEKKNAVLDHFNRVAPRYDFMNTVLSFGIHHAWKRTAVRMLRLRPGDRILDVCGGTGDLAVLCARRIGPEGRVFLYDINRAMMQSGIGRPENQALRGQIHYIQGDAEIISFPDGRFDAAMVGFGIRNLTHLKKGFSEMFRVLRPGGKMMCLEFSKPVNPVFRSLYDFYSFSLMPAIGSLLAGSGKSYACLSETIRMFATPEELQTILEEIGFREVLFRRLTNGIAAVHIGRKPRA